MTSDLPGQARAKAPLNIFTAHFMLYFITSREGWKKHSHRLGNLREGG